MSATASYDGRAFEAAVYAAYPDRATLDLLDKEDVAIALRALDRFSEARRDDVDALWRLSHLVRWSRYVDEQAQAAIERADEAPPSTRPSVAPGDEDRARRADARAKEGGRG